MPITRFKDEEERRKYLEELRKTQENNLNIAEQKHKEASEQFDKAYNKKNTLDQFNNFITNFPKNISYMDKKSKAGGLQALTGIVQSGTTDIANSLNNGEKKSTLDLVNDTLNGMMRLILPQAFTYSTMGSESLKKQTDLLLDKNKSVQQKLVGLVTNAGSDAVNSIPGKKLIDSGIQNIGKIAPNSSEKVMEFNDWISKPSKDLNAKLAEEAQNYDEITQTLGNVTQSVGNMAPSIVTSLVTGNPSLSLGLMGMNVKGQATQEALDKGAELDEAVKIGNTKAMAEVGTEMLTGGVNIFGKGALDDIVQRGIVSKVKNNIARKLVENGIDISGEILEETISDVLGTTIDRGTVDPNTKYTIKDWSDTAITTTLTTLLLKGFGIGGSIDNNNQQKKVDSSVTNKESSQTISNSLKSLVDSAKAYNLNVNDETIQSINQKLNDRGITGKFDESLFRDTSGKVKTDINALWKTSTDENGNIKREVIFNPHADTQKTMQQVSIHEMLHDFEGSNEAVELSKLILDKNSKREGYKEARQQLEEIYSKVYDRNSENFKSLVDQEEVADTLAQKLGDQDFINSLNKEKPSVFKRVYNWIVDKLNKFTGSKNEKIYWENVKNKFESAYKQDYQGEGSSNKFSIQTDSNGNKFVKIDTNQDIFKGKTLSEQTKIAKQYILDNFRDKGLKLDDENVNVTSKTANEYTHPKNQLPYKTKQAKIKASTELDNMLNVSDYQYSSNDDGRHRFAKDGWDYYKTVFEVDGVKFEGIVNIAKSGNKKTFYDVTNIKRISQNRSASDKSFSTSLTNSTNSISTSNKNVNTTNNKSMKKEEKNTSKASINFNDQWQSFLEKEIGTTGKGKTVKELKLPTKEWIENKKIDAYNVLFKDNDQINKLNLPIEKGGKTRKHYKSIIQSSNTSPEAKAIAKELIGSDTYVPDSNERQLASADERIIRNGADNEALSLAIKVKNNDKITADDIATGERLIEYYSKIGNKEKLQDTIQNVALAGTQAGQTVQAMSLINRQTPQGQAVYLSKVIDRMNNAIDKRTKGKGKKFELTPDMLEKITTSSKENLETNIDEVARKLANQVPKTTIEKIDSWRYFSMLANPRTHIRNIVGNFSMAGVQNVKNKVAGGLEAIAQKTGMIDQRTKTLKPASKEVKKFAKKDVENVLGRLNNESKFDTRNMIQQYQRTFKSDVLEKTLGKAFDLNSKALEKEDIFGLKRAYRKSLADYMTANKLTEKDLTAGTREADINLEKARKYAIEQAQEATFHQQSALSSLLNTFENKNTATKLLTGAIIPFKKTPINVAKTGMEYSPIGLIKSFTLDVVKLNKGEMTVNKYIDNLSKGITGTGIAVVGYALAQAGIVSASGDDDNSKKQYYRSDRGEQAFSIKIGDKTYTLDWLSPTAIPLFIGAELNNNIQNGGKEENTEDFLEQLANGIDSMTKAMNPMVEMSMLSGLASTIKSFAKGDTQVFSNFLTNSAKSYVNQFFPTLGGQITKMIDDTERSTTSTKKNAFAKAVDSTGKQILNKIPFASKLLPAKTDVWGNELKREENPLYRALQQAVFPWNEKTLKSTDVDNAISDLYKDTGEKSVLPNTTINKDFTLNGEKYRLTSEEYAEYKKQYGKNSYDALNGLTTSKEYKNMNNEQRIEAISKIYEYANERNKVEYANKKKMNIETSSLYNTVTSIEKEGGKASDYFKYLGQTTGVEKTDEKIKILSESNIPSKSKSSIYVNTIGKSDDLYIDVLERSNINIKEYLKYKQQKFESDKEDNGTLEGKTITNSKKQKIYDYVNKMDITYSQKLLILGKQYKLNREEQNDLYSYINNISSKTAKEKLEILKKYSNNFEIYKDGTLNFK